VVGNRVERVSFGMVVWGKGHLIEGNEVCRLVWGSGVNDCDYVRFFGEGHIFRRNYLHGTKKEEVGPAHVDGWQTYAVNPGEYARDILIEGNILTDFCHQGVLVSGGVRTSLIVIRNNVFAGMRNGIVVQHAREIDVCNNTLLLLERAFPSGVGISIGGRQSTVKIRNNIILNGIPLVTEGELRDSYGTVLTQVTGNLFRTTFKKYGLFGDKNILCEDPLLVEAGSVVGGDGKPFTEDDGYRLMPQSPCVDRGVPIPEWADARDIVGTKRPTGRQWDIGAWEAAEEEGDGKR